MEISGVFWPWLQIWFNHVRVPRADMLDAFASVSAEGTYSSPIKSVGARFGTMVGGLTTGAAEQLHVPSPMYFLHVTLLFCAIRSCL